MEIGGSKCPCATFSLASFSYTVFVFIFAACDIEFSQEGDSDLGYS